MKSSTTLFRAALLISAGTFLSTDLGAVTINFNTASSCFAANFGGTRCSQTPGSAVFSNSTNGDTATVTFTPDSGTATFAQGTSFDFSYGSFQLNFSAGAGDPGRTGYVAVPETTLVLAIDQTGATGDTFTDLTITISGDTPTDGFVGYGRSNLQVSSDLVSVSVANGVSYYKIVPTVQMIPETNTSFAQFSFAQALDPAVAPEPGTMLLMGFSLGLVGLVAARRKLQAR
jgi:hypothetical protein